MAVKRPSVVEGNTPGKPTISDKLKENQGGHFSVMKRKPQQT